MDCAAFRAAALLAVLLLPLAGSEVGFSAPRVVPGWGSWRTTTTPVLSGTYGIAGDPCVVRTPGGLRMLLSAFDPAKTPQGPVVCAATSNDGLAWSYEASADPLVPGRVTITDSGMWYDTRETPFALRLADGSWQLWFTGYVDHGGFLASLPGAFGYARADGDGAAFNAPLTAPVLTPASGLPDRDRLSSPSVVLADGVYHLVYAGWDLHAATPTTLLSATSSDGMHWTRAAAPLLAGITLPAYCTVGSLAEPELIRGPDGTWLLFFTATQGARGHNIGMATAPAPDGPWSISPEPIIVPTAGRFDAREVVAPSVLMEHGMIRLWYAGFNEADTAIAIGYAESAWPAVTPPGPAIPDGTSTHSGCGLGSTSLITLALLALGLRQRQKNSPDHQR